MPWWPGRRPNVNDKYHLPTFSAVTHVSQLKDLPTSGDVAAEEANDEHAEMWSDEARRQRRKFMMGVIRASRAILDQKDKRRRPKGIRKEEWKAARKLRLTRTKRRKAKKKPRPQ